MYIKPFQVEEWMNAYEEQARYNIAETCADSVSMEELFALTGQDGEQFWRDFSARRLTYGSIEGVPGILEGICRLYKTVKPEHIVPTHGAAGANHHIFCSLLEPGDEVISIMPTYQQLYSIPEAFGARVKILELSPKDRYHLNLNDLREAVTDETKMICLNNPNNPTGALMRSDELEEVVRIAKAWEHGFSATRFTAI